MLPFLPEETQPDFRTGELSPSLTITKQQIQHWVTASNPEGLGQAGRQRLGVSE